MRPRLDPPERRRLAAGLEPPSSHDAGTSAPKVRWRQPALWPLGGEQAVPQRAAVGTRSSGEPCFFEAETARVKT